MDIYIDCRQEAIPWCAVCNQNTCAEYVGEHFSPIDHIERLRKNKELGKVCKKLYELNDELRTAINVYEKAVMIEEDKLNLLKREVSHMKSGKDCLLYTSPSPRD
eukprot:TRINITY_DN9569_c0_g1_i6.p1 TRINITY_DN9569_c0_g1~~TRINITY_DN9569_c0_g1_i6.p1  ORF type:complete len:105 (+),score=16.17 TRINITY_DN9569_c0_g1_i6:101-415(+)